MAAPARNRGWIWYFAILVLLTAGSITVMIVYNMGRQLKPEQLEQARKLWKEKGPADYGMEYTVKTATSNDLYQVQVRHGKVQSVVSNGLTLPKDKYVYHDMPGLFSEIEQFLIHARAPGSPRTFMAAKFDDAGDGHLIQFIRRVVSTNERVEINVALTPVK
jgi:hypothetical protein